MTENRPEIARNRPVTFDEVVGNVARRWHWVLLVSIVGIAGALGLTKNIRLEYEAEGTFRIARDLPSPKLDNNVHIPKEEPFEPLIIANILLEEALSQKALARLFMKRAAIFASEAEDQGGKFNDYIHKYAKIIPLTETHYKVVCRAKEPLQAQELV